METPVDGCFSFWDVASGLDSLLVPFRTPIYSTKEVLSHLSTVTSPSLLPMRGPTRGPGGSPGGSDSAWGYELNVSSARRVACFSRACPCSLQAHNYGRWTPRSWLLRVASGHAFCWKTEGLIQGRLERARVRGPRLPGRLVAKVSELSSQPKWVEGHPTTHLLGEGAEIRCF